MARIFICYRRDDSSGHAGRLRDSLSMRLGRDEVFRDIETIGPGEDFRRAMSRAIASCDVFLAIIGPHWLSTANADGTRRLEALDDYVRHEIVEALGRGVRVIPVLVGGAAVPQASDLPEPLKPLATRNAITLDDEGWDADVERLTAAIGLERQSAVSGVISRVPGGRRTLLIALSLAVLFVMIAAPLVNRARPAPDGRGGVGPASTATDEVATSGSTPTGNATSKSPNVGPAAAGGGATPTLPAGGEAELGQTVYEIMQVAVAPHAGGSTLTLGLRLTNNSVYAVVFTDSEFRLLQGEDPVPPARPVTEIVPSESTKDGTLTFELPSNPANAVLRISHASETAEVPLDLTGRRGLTAEAAREARRAGETTFHVPIDPASAAMRFGDVTCVLQSASVRRLAHKLTLTLGVRVENRGRYDAGYGDGNFRLRIDDMVHAPADSFYKIVRADGTGQADVVFDVPSGTNRVVLRVRFGEDTAEVPLSLGGRAGS